VTIPRCCMLWIALCCALPAVTVAAAEMLPPDKPIHEVVDHYVRLGLQEAGVMAAPQADEANFVRRVTLDLVGRIPTVFEVKAYLESTDPNKRVQLVDRLMQSPEFAAHQVNELDTLLMYGSSGSLREYLAKAVAEHRPWDRIFRELVAGNGENAELKGADQFLKVRAKDSDRLTNDVSMLFFGVNISCTQCHDHPLVSDWKQDHFYGLKSFFNRTFENGGFLAERDYGTVSFKTPQGEDRNAKLMFLSGTVLDEPKVEEPNNADKKKESEQLKEWAQKKVSPPPPKFSRRALLLDVALRPGENRFFARAIANRLFYRLLGYGLVMPVDQMHSENPPSHPELLDWLERDMIAGGFDLPRLIRGLVLSETYSRSSRWDNGDRPEASLFAVANIRPLTSFQYAAALRLATHDPEALGPTPEELRRKIEGLVNSSRSLSSSFDMPQDNFQVSATESLFFSNGDKIVKELLVDGNDRLLGRLKQTIDAKSQIDMAIWTVLSRAPTEEETKLLEAYLSQRSERPADALSQMVWALLSGAEFRFNY
jgi:hypothetical protein